jgi:hypothetical protein
LGLALYDNQMTMGGQGGNNNDGQMRTFDGDNNVKGQGDNVEQRGDNNKDGQQQGRTAASSLF